MITTDKTGIARLINQCVAHGMKHVVCSPGSRNAPLIIAIDNHSSIETIVVHDERSAAFYALGMSQELKAPVGVVCTSGSAMLNYYPAVAEAYYQCIPLVVLSADRPEEWVNHGDGQTIVQKNVYSNHIRFEAQVEEMLLAGEEDVFDALIHEAFVAGNGDWKGPIHFNCPVSEPLYGTVEVAEYAPESILVEGDTGFPESLKDALKSEWLASKRKMILCGQMEGNPVLLSKLAELAGDGSVAVLVENTSNLVHPKFNHCIDRSLSAIPADKIEEYQPDLLITIGGAIISKRIKKFLRGSSVIAHWKIGFEFPEMDTYRKLTHSVSCQPKDLFSEILSWNAPQHTSSYGLKWKKIDYLNQDKLPDFIQNAAYSDLTVFETLLDYIPDNTVLHMANSSVVRYCQLFDPVASVKYYSNRGTSGIDGSSSTAAGASIASPDKLHLLITGDMSFFYDSNAFWNNNLGGNLKVIVINNSGGGIFRIIDGPSGSGLLEKYFETKQPFSAEKLSAAFNLEYLKATTIQELEEQLPEFLGSKGDEVPQLLEIFTPNIENDKVLKDFFKHFAPVAV